MYIWGYVSFKFRSNVFTGTDRRAKFFMYKYMCIYVYT